MDWDLPFGVYMGSLELAVELPALVVDDEQVVRCLEVELDVVRPFNPSLLGWN